MKKEVVRLYKSKPLEKMTKKELKKISHAFKDRLFELRYHWGRSNKKESESNSIREGKILLAKVAALLEAEDDFERMVIGCLF